MKTNLLIAVIFLAAVAAFGVQPQKKSTVNKDARFYVKHFEESNTAVSHVRDDYEYGLYYVDDRTGDLAMNWDDGQGGKQTWKWKETISSTYVNPPQTSTLKTTNTWPATFWPDLVPGTFEDDPLGFSDDGPHIPVIVRQQCDIKSKQDYSFAAIADDGLSYYQGPFIEEGHLTGTPHAKMVIKFYAGGMGLPKRKSVYQASCDADAYKQVGVAGNYKSPLYGSTPIQSQNIILGDLGPLDPDGILYAVIDDGSTKDITPKVAGVPWFTFAWPVLTKYTLSSQVSCQALTDTNLERTSLGVAEVVHLGTMPAETTWNTTAGTLSVGQGGHGIGTYLYAPHIAATATVTATIRKVILSIDFDVVEPSGVSSTIRSRDGFNSSISEVGAGMQLDVVIQPTSVSFSKIEMEEPAEPTTGITHYFLNVDLARISHAGNGAGPWHPVNCGNYIMGPPIDFFDHASSYDWQGPFGQGGSYTWPIHPIWRVVGDTATHSLSGWTDQIMTLSSDGTMRVDKLGHHVTRHTYEPYGIAQ